jgi:hypothetical protein
VTRLNDATRRSIAQALFISPHGASLATDLGT